MDGAIHRNGHADGRSGAGVASAKYGPCPAARRGSGDAPVGRRSAGGDPLRPPEPRHGDRRRQIRFHIRTFPPPHHRRARHEDEWRYRRGRRAGKGRNAGQAAHQALLLSPPRTGIVREDGTDHCGGDGHQSPCPAGGRLPVGLHPLPAGSHQPRLFLHPARRACGRGPLRRSVGFLFPAAAFHIHYHEAGRHPDVFPLLRHRRCPCCPHVPAALQPDHARRTRAQNDAARGLFPGAVAVHEPR